MYQDELKILEKHIHSLELAEQSVLHYKQALDLLQDKFLDAYLIQGVIKFGEEQQGIVVFIISKLRKVILCIKAAFINDTESQVLNRFYTQSHYSSAELDEEFLSVESYNTYSIEYSNQIAIDIYRSFDSHLISRIILDLEKENNVDRIKNKIYEICKKKKDVDISIHIGFQDVSSIKYRTGSELEKGYKKISFMLEELEGKAKEEIKKEENNNPVVQVQPKKNELGDKFNQFYQHSYRNFFFVQTIVDPINGITIDKITEEHNVYVNFIDNKFKNLLEEDKENKNLSFPYKDLFECKSDKKYYLFMHYKNSILYSIEEDKGVRLKVENVSEVNNENKASNKEQYKKYLDSEFSKVGLMALILFVLLIYLLFK